MKFSYSYAQSGNLDTIEERIGGTLLARRTYGWDALHRSVSITEDMASSAASLWTNDSIGTDKHITFNYDAISNLTGINRYKSTSATSDDRGATTISYFSTGNVHELTHSVATSSGQQTIGEFTQEYLVNGKLNFLQKQLGADIREDIHFGFDQRGNLQTVTTNDLNNVNGQTVRNVTIDINENHSQASTAQFGFDGRIYEESTGVGKQNVYTYDKVGHVIQKLQQEYVDGESTGYYANMGHTDYTWDLLGQLASVSDEHTHAVDYFYDALGREMARDERTLNASGATTSSKQLVILYDLTGRVMSIDLSNDRVVEHDLNGIAQTGVLAIDQTGAAGTPTTTVWQYANSGGDVTTIGIVTSGGWLFRYRDFDEDGNLQRTAGDSNWALENAAVIWHGLRYDPFAELYRIGTSGMEPEHGRMISKVGGSYTFANNDPTEQYVRSEAVGDVTALDVLTSREMAVYASGAVSIVGGVVDMGVGISACVSVIGCVGGALAIANGIDAIAAGVRTFSTGEVQETLLHSSVRRSAQPYVDSESAEGLATAADLGVGIASGGLTDTAKTLSKVSGRKAISQAIAHGARHASVEAGGVAAGAGIGYAATGTLDGALLGANLGSIAGGITANYAVACFTAGTPLVIDHAGNSRPIEDIEVGDYVLARSEFDPDGPLELKRVAEKFVRVSPVMELVIAGRSIKTTAEHPFYVPRRQAFVPAGELKAGVELVSHDGRLIAIDSVNSTGEVATVYNMRVADHHTYFVGGEVWGWDVWVHNTYAIVTNFRNKSRLVEGADGDLWYLPARYKTTRQISVNASLDRYGTQLQSKVDEIAGNFTADLLSRKEQRHIRKLWAKYNSTNDSKWAGAAVNYTMQQKGQYVEKQLTNWIRESGMDLVRRSGNRGIDYHDPITGVNYELLRGSTKNIRDHAYRDGMTDEIWRLITFK